MSTDRTRDRVSSTHSVRCSVRVIFLPLPIPLRCQIVVMCHPPPSSPVLGVSLVQTALVHVTPDVNRPSRSRSSFLPLTSISIVCFTIFHPSTECVRPYQRNLARLGFYVTFSTADVISPNVAAPLSLSLSVPFSASTFSSLLFSEASLSLLVSILLLHRSAL